MAKRVVASPTPDLNQPISKELIGAAVRARRTQAGLKLEDAAPLCGVAKSTLIAVEQGKPGVKLDSILLILSGLGIRLSIEHWGQGANVTEPQGAADDEWF